jgi:hypothetical protein
MKMLVTVDVKEDKLLKFFDILNALRDDFVIDFNAEYEEEMEDVEYDNETGDNKS